MTGLSGVAAHVPIPKSPVTLSPPDTTSVRQAPSIQMPNGSVDLVSPVVQSPLPLPSQPPPLAIADGGPPTAPVQGTSFSPGERTTVIPDVRIRQAIAEYDEQILYLSQQVEHYRMPSAGPPLMGDFNSRDAFEAEAGMYHAARAKLVECGE